MRVCGGSTAHKPGSLPPFSTPRALPCRPRLLVEVVFSLWLPTTIGGLFPGPHPGPNQLWEWSADPARFHAGVIRQRSLKSLWSVVSSQQLGCERARQSSSEAHCVENSPSPCCCQWRNRPPVLRPRNSLNSSRNWWSWRLSNEAACRRSNRSRSRDSYPRKTIFHQKLQQQLRILAIGFLLSHSLRANLRCIPDPQPELHSFSRRSNQRPCPLASIPIRTLRASSVL